MLCPTLNVSRKAFAIQTKTRGKILCKADRGLATDRGYNMTLLGWLSCDSCAHNLSALCTVLVKFATSRRKNGVCQGELAFIDKSFLR